jgi:2-desacetyl-2-hydroxyethyl bacteriochlorophyllide A dehydrogenase
LKSPTIVFTAPLRLAIEEREVREPAPTEFLARARVSAISTGTEMTLFSGTFPEGSVWARIAQYPITPGYCHVGEVIEVGSEVRGVQRGERVVGWKPHTMYALYSVGDFWVKVPEEVGDDEAATLPLAIISLNGVRRAKLELGESVAVFGLGPIGIFASLFSRIAGCRPVIGVDVVESRRRLAERCGAVHVTLDGSEVGLVDKVKTLTRGRMLDVVFETTGSPDAIVREAQLLRPQGRLVVLSSPRGPTLFDFHDYCNRPSLTIIGAHVTSHPPHENPSDPWTRERNAELYLDLVREGLIQAKQLITHRFPWREAAEAYQLLQRDRGETGIVILNWA